MNTFTRSQKMLLGLMMTGSKLFGFSDGSFLLQPAIGDHADNSNTVRSLIKRGYLIQYRVESISVCDEPGSLLRFPVRLSWGQVPSVALL
jgi:hypothetical protein